MVGREEKKGGGSAVMGVIVQHEYLCTRMLYRRYLFCLFTSIRSLLLVRWRECVASGVPVKSFFSRNPKKSNDGPFDETLSAITSFTSLHMVWVVTPAWKKDFRMNRHYVKHSLRLLFITLRRSSWMLIIVQSTQSRSGTLLWFLVFNSITEWYTVMYALLRKKYSDKRHICVM